MGTRRIPAKERVGSQTHPRSSRNLRPQNKKTRSDGRLNQNWAFAWLHFHRRPPVPGRPSFLDRPRPCPDNHPAIISSRSTNHSCHHQDVRPRAWWDCSAYFVGQEERSDRAAGQERRTLAPWPAVAAAVGAMQADREGNDWAVVVAPCLLLAETSWVLLMELPWTSLSSPPPCAFWW
eukprot:scaffold435_cov342-Pavlova_lutheri.AAC.40